MPSVAIIGTRGYPSYYGGFETAVRKLAPYLADAGWDVTVYSRPGSTREEDPSRDHRIDVVKTWGIERKSLSTLSYGYTATRHAVKSRADAALVMNVANGYWLPLLKQSGIPTLVNVDGIEWDRAKWGRVAKQVFRTGARLTAKHGDTLVYDAQEIERRWRDGFGVGGVFIPYGGDVPNETLPVEPGLRHRGYALIVARFVPENTIPEFFDAVPRISEELDVVLVGSSGYGGELDAHAKRLAADNPRVRWMGHVSDDRRLHSLWQHAAVYFHGHSVGGTNPALVQAMACGAPIIARDTVYNREVLGPAGEFVNADAASIADAIVRLAASPATQSTLVGAAIARARSEYSWGAVCAKYETALRALVLSTPSLSGSRI